MQITTSSLDPGVLKYAAQISSPTNGVQPITFVFDDYKSLEASLTQAAEELNPQKVEIAFHQNRVNSYKNKIVQHEERVKVLESPDYNPEEDGIEMEEVS